MNSSINLLKVRPFLDDGGGLYMTENDVGGFVLTVRSSRSILVYSDLIASF